MADLGRRDFLLRFCQGTGATLVPIRLWGLTFPRFDRLTSVDEPPGASGYHLHPRYRSERPLDSTLAKVQPGLDQFVTETYAEKIDSILSEWSAALLASPREAEAIARTLSGDFLGTSPVPSESRVIRSSAALQVRKNKFSGQTNVAKQAFMQAWQSVLNSFSRIEIAEFQIVGINAAPLTPSKQLPDLLGTRIRYEFVGSGTGFNCQQCIGTWDIAWKSNSSGEFCVGNWQVLDETEARSMSPIYADVGAQAFGANSSYSAQMLQGTDHWRTLLDGACGIDIYGHNGVSVADIDNDGFDDLYVCQPAGLPNRLYRNRGDGTFEDVTETSGLGILENTACALFADFDNDGRQDVILVRTSGPLLFLNEGGGKFRQNADAFQFTTPPEGTFTGAAVADYDRDGWLDIYFCLYSYYQGTGQYKYPSPYHDAENGPPNFMMRNNRDGTFRDVTAESGLNKNNTRYSFCCGWGDYNRDGWPDLYVVNDFGRKNLYRNNGDGTFTDVASQMGVEDVGAGMSVCWADFDNDGAEDLYIANMWTAAGVRVSMQDIFKNSSMPEVRALYQKHAMGNSLLLNRGATFDAVTKSASVGVGRWSWSSDSFDFDHDGFQDLYVVNGMVSGPSRSDLNSFFWRQVVANSPDEAGASREYEQGWNAINELIRSDGTWSGYERNILYANNGDGTFSDVSAIAGLDFIEDGRSFAFGDFDHDGRLEIFLKNRNAPQLRLLKNVLNDLPPSISFRLQGTKSNRDAIGASVTIQTDSGRQTKTLRAGSGFLSQHSKDVFFGLGETTGQVQATILWPSGLVQSLQNLPINHRVWVVEGSLPSKIEEFKRSSPAKSIAPGLSATESSPTRIETWLLAPVPAPEIALPDLSQKSRSLLSMRRKPALVYVWITESADCQADLHTFEKNYSRWSAQGLQLLTINADGFASQTTKNGMAPDQEFNVFMRGRRFSFPIVRASDDVAAIYNIMFRQLFDRHRDLPLPTSFLIDENGYIVKVYQGPIVTEHVDRDFRSIPRTDADRVALALPFPGRKHNSEFGRNNLSLGALFFQRGYLDQAKVSFEEALRDDPASAEALYGIGSVYLNQNKNASAREMFERCVKLKANYPDTLPDAWNNLGVLATREGHVDDSVASFQQALKLNPRHLLALDNLGNAYRSQKRWDDARRVLEFAIEIAPDDAEANYSLGMVFAQTGDNGKAYEHLQRALKARPDYPEALNNLGVLYVVTQRRDEAVAAFEQCIHVAPQFDQSYLNLARVYALEGARDKARSVLMELLKQNPDHPQAKKMLAQLQ